MALMIRVFICALALVGLTASPALAAKKKEKFDRVFSLSDPRYGQFACGEKSGAFTPGTMKKKRFSESSKELVKLQKSLAKAERKKKKNQSKIDSLRAQVDALSGLIAARSMLCAGDDPDAPQVGDDVSLAELSRPVTEEDARYLLEKAGFGAAAEDQPLIQLGVANGVSALVDEFMRLKPEPEGLLTAVHNRANLASETPTPKRQRAALLDLWIHTNNPYSEKLALFLLGVWTVARDLIPPGTTHSAFWDYYTRLRAAASGETDLPQLALAITRDPLMLRYLDNDENTRGNPNENYARELMELFTLGPRDLDGNANYTETQLDGSGDIAVAARMLTGYRVHIDFQTGIAEARYEPARHAPGPHVMFSSTAHQFSGENDQDLVLGIFEHHPSVKYYYSQEILREYVTANPPRALVEAFGEVIAANGYHLRPAMAVLFKSRAFYHPAYRNTVPKNSAEFLVETVRTLEMEQAVDPDSLEQMLVSAGMPINDSPSVFWFPASQWTSASVFLARINAPAQLFGEAGGAPGVWSPALLLPAGAASAEDVAASAAHKLGIQPLSGDPLASVVHYLNTVRLRDGSERSAPYDNLDSDSQRAKGLGAYYVLIGSPEFQLK